MTKNLPNKDGNAAARNNPRKLKRLHFHIYLLQIRLKYGSYAIIFGKYD
jgi:hypothetical protein